MRGIYIYPTYAKAYDVSPLVASDVRQFARILVVACPASSGTELGKLERDRRKVTPAGGERHVDPVDTEANNIRPTIAIHIRQLARILIVTRPTGSRTELGKLKIGRMKSACGGTEILYVDSVRAGIEISICPSV